MPYNDNVGKIVEKAKKIAIKKNNKELCIEHLIFALVNDHENNLYKLIIEKKGEKYHEDFLSELDLKISALPPRNNGDSLDENIRYIEFIDEVENKAVSNVSLKDIYLELKQTKNELANKLFEELALSDEEIDKLNLGDSILDEVAIEMVKAVEDGKIERIIGREKEVYSLVEILLKRYKNNPVLRGNPGVGKRTLVSGLAYNINHNTALAKNLDFEKIYKLNTNLLMATDAYKGDFAKNVEKMALELNKSNAILFIDDASYFLKSEGEKYFNMLKAALEKNKVKMIMTATYDELKGHVTSNKMFASEFQVLDINELSIEDTLNILRKTKKATELAHGVKVLDESIEDIVNLSSKYMRNEFFPNKAIHLLDTCCASVRLKSSFSTPELDLVSRNIQNIEVKINSLVEDNLDKSNREILKLEEELKKLKSKEKSLSDQYLNIREKEKEIKKLEEEYNELNKKYDSYVNESNIEEASKLKYGEMYTLEKKINDLTTEVYGVNGNNVVRSKDVFEKISEITKIPMYKLGENDLKKYLSVGENLKNRVTGQDEAIATISKSLIRAASGISEDGKPKGVFMFVGPSGVGKTELAKSLAESVFGTENEMIRIDMSEFQEEHKVSGLIGAPAGYVGYEEGGVLTDAVRNKPYSVVLIDELEKAHPKILDLFLQVMDDARLTDAKGQTVDFSNTILIFTSNIGSQYLMENNNEENRNKVKEEIKQRLRPEFINRFDNILYFNSLSKDNMRFIVDKQINLLKLKLSKQGFDLDIDEDVYEQIVTDPSININEGARNVKSLVRTKIYDTIGPVLIAYEDSEAAAKNVHVYLGEQGKIEAEFRDSDSKQVLRGR